MPNLIRNKHGDLRNLRYYRNVRIQYHFWPGASLAAGNLYPRIGLTVQRYGPSFFQHNHNPDLAVEMVLDGTEFYEDDGIQYQVGPGELYLVHHNAETKLSTQENNHYRKLVLCITGSLLDPVVESLRLGNVRHLKPENPREFESLFHTLFSLLDGRKSGTEPLVAGGTYELLFRLSETSHSTRGAYPVALLKALDFIGRRFQEPIRQEQIAQAAEVSQPTLVRLFRRHLGRNPMEHLIETRLEFARSMIATDLPIKEISWRCGYASAYYFSTAFRKKYGLSPQNFRKKAVSGE